MVYGYVRVSTEKQTVENQRFEIENFCEKEKLKLGAWVEETISGTKKVEDRQLGELLKTLTKGDVVICSELSRLGRNLLMIMSILNRCMEEGIKIYTIKDNYRLGDDISSKVLAFAFGLSAEIERNLISQRTKEALARVRAQGIKLGRPIGSFAPKEKLKLNKFRDSIIDGILSGVKITKLCRELGVCYITPYRYVKRLEQSGILPTKKEAA
jgi:DNA invertase Pin-like site-specific DNA recombinase